MSNSRNWTVAKLGAVCQALMEFSEHVEGAEHRSIAHHKDGLGKRVSNWLRDNKTEEFYLGVSEAGSALRHLFHMDILSESTSRKDRSRIFYNTVEITQKLVDKGYEVARAKQN